MLYITEQFQSELQCSNVEKVIVLWLSWLGCIYSVFNLFLELFALLKGGDEIPRQVHWRKGYFHLFNSFIFACKRYKNVISMHYFQRAW